MQSRTNSNEVQQHERGRLRKLNFMLILPFSKTKNFWFPFKCQPRFRSWPRKFVVHCCLFFVCMFSVWTGARTTKCRRENVYLLGFGEKKNRNAWFHSGCGFVAIALTISFSLLPCAATIHSRKLRENWRVMLKPSCQNQSPQLGEEETNSSWFNLFLLTHTTSLFRWQLYKKKKKTQTPSTEEWLLY